ncbi:capsid assembly protein [Lysobacter sp. Hz 25]|uniref:capsid assembly protein n=1 Tax=Lysobacter sp. Hz 25 TaxID=3383698 RepID=UPI0038D501B7
MSTADPGSTPPNDGTAVPPADGGNAAPDYAGFASVEELVAAHKALKAPPEPSKNADLAIKPKDEAGDAGVKSVLTAAGLNQDDFTKEFAETGDLGKESRAKLEKAGFDSATVDVYLDGLKARRSSYEAQLYEGTKGKEGYAALTAWASQNLSDGDIDAFNATISSGNAAQAKLAVAGLVARMNAGKATLLNGKTSSAGGVTPYASQAEVRTAVNDPRYRTDPAYRKAHEARLMASTF